MAKAPNFASLVIVSRNHLSDSIFFLDGRPGIGKCSFETQSDLLGVSIHGEDGDIHFLTDMQNLAGMINAVVRKLRDMDESIGAAEVDESAETGQVADDATPYLSGLKLIEQFIFTLGALLLNCRALRQDKPVTAAIDLDDLERQTPVDHGRQRLGDFLVFAVLTRDVAQIEHLRYRDESAYSFDIDDEAAFVVVDHRGLDDRTLVVQLLDVAPGTLQSRPSEREDSMAFGTLGLHDVDQDAVAGMQWLDFLVFGVQFASRNNALGFHADIDQDFVLIDAHDRALDGLAAFQAMEGVLVFS